MVDPDEVRARVAARIREVAKAKSVRVTNLPGIAGVSRAHLMEVLAGRASPSLDFLSRVANGLGIDPSEFLRRPRRAAPGLADDDSS